MSCKEPSSIQPSPPPPPNTYPTKQFLDLPALVPVIDGSQPPGLPTLIGPKRKRGACSCAYTYTLPYSTVPTLSYLPYSAYPTYSHTPPYRHPAQARCVYVCIHTYICNLASRRSPLPISHMQHIMHNYPPPLPLPYQFIQASAPAPTCPSPPPRRGSRRPKSPRERRSLR